MALSVQEFSAKIKAKYPEYSSVDDKVLAEKIIAKYPEYKGKVDMSVTDSGAPNVMGAVNDASNQMAESMNQTMSGYQSPGSQFAKPWEYTEEDFKTSEVGKAVTSPGGQQAISNAYKSAIPGGDLGIGVGKGVISSAMGASELVGRGMDAIVKPLAQGFGYKSPDFEQMDQFRQDVTKSDNDVQEAGKIAEQIGEYILPMGGVAKLGKVAEGAIGASKGSKVVKSIFDLGTKMALEGAAGGAVSAAQEGDINKNVTDTAAISALMPVAGKAFELAKGGLSKMSKLQISKLIRPDKNAYLFGKDPAAAIVSEKITANNWDDLVKNIGSKKKEIGQAIGENVRKADKSKIIDVSKIIQSNADDFVGRTTDQNVWKTFSDKVAQLTHDVKGDLNTGAMVRTGTKDLTKVNAEQLWQMQQKVGKLAQWTGAVGEKEVNQQLHKLYGQLGKELNKLAPGTKPLQSRWADIMGAEKAAVARKAVVERNNNIVSSGIGAMTGNALINGSGNSDPVKQIGATILGAVAPRVINSPAFRTKLAQLLTEEGVSNPEVAKAVKAITEFGASKMSED